MFLAYEPRKGKSGHAVGRALLETLYGKHVGGQMPEICLSQRGKPYFSGEKWHFSISHTPKHVFCVLSRQNIGMDAEEKDRKIDPRMADKWLSPGEREQYLAAENRQEALLKFWVLKEAYAKLTGFGIGAYLKSTEFILKNSPVFEKNGCFIAILEDEESAV